HLAAALVASFAARLNPALTSLTQATYLGGSQGESSSGLFVTGSAVFVTGSTGSFDFPGTAGGAQPITGGSDAYIARLDLALTSLTQATYLGGSGGDSISGLFATGSEVFVAGTTGSGTDFPRTAAGGPPDMRGRGES